MDSVKKRIVDRSLEEYMEWSNRVWEMEKMREEMYSNRSSIQR
jgi:hypothetical protein